MAEQSNLIVPKELTKIYEDAIRKNLAALMQSTGISQTQLVAKLEERGLSVNQGNLSHILAGGKHLPLSILVQLCDIFNVTLAELVDENFGAAKEAVTAPGHAPQLYSDDLLLQVPYLGESFVTDPLCQEFHGYLQTYHVYTHPNNVEDTKLITGTLTLEANGSVCEATLQLNSNKTREGKPVYRVYHGRAIISKSVNAVYVLLTSSIEGHLCVISFRHIFLPHQPLACRVAAVLTNTVGEYHAPTIHRMLLSRTAFEPEHLPLLTSHLLLNSNDIRIPEPRLAEFAKKRPEYATLLENLARFGPTETYFWSEDYILGIARQFLDQRERCCFLSELRNLSSRSACNKASRRADLLMRDLLLSLGYYKDLDL